MGDVIRMRTVRHQMLEVGQIFVIRRISVYIMFSVVTI